jgi:hypothetical protein
MSTIVMVKQGAMIVFPLFWRSAQSALPWFAEIPKGQFCLFFHFARYLLHHPDRHFIQG